MKKLLMLLPILLLVSCMSNPNRRLFSDNLVGADLETARDSTQAIVMVDQQKALAEALVDDAKAQGKIINDANKHLDKAGSALDKYPSAKTAVSPHLNDAKRNLVLLQKIQERMGSSAEEVKKKASDLEPLLTGINYRSQGKKYMSKLKLFIIWLAVGAVILLIFGIAIRTLPFFQPLHRLLSGLMNGVMDMTSGMWDARRRAQIKHLNMTKTIRNEELDPILQAAIKEEEARLKREEARKLAKEKEGFEKYWNNEGK
jgi:hypothetical protein